MDWGALINYLTELVGLNLAIFTLCTTKYALGAWLALGYGQSIYESIFFTAAGGITGVFFYLYVYELILRIFKKEVKTIKIKFNRWRRFLIVVKQKGGLLGISIVTPILISIPLGIALSISLGSTKKRILIFHIGSVLFWSFLIFTIKYGLGYDLTESLGK